MGSRRCSGPPERGRILGKAKVGAAGFQSGRGAPSGRCFPFGDMPFANEFLSLQRFLLKLKTKALPEY
ncbi:hypothetical protein NN561_016088 [Cricetulus griseus]